MRVFAAATLLGSGILALACGPAEPEYMLVTAPNGRSFKLESVSDVVRPDGEAALLLSYRSELDFANSSALESEVEMVWGYLRPEVESRGLRAAVIRASQWEKPSWERRGRAAQYVIERSAQGGWAGRPDPASAALPVAGRRLSL